MYCTNNLSYVTPNCHCIELEKTWLPDSIYYSLKKKLCVSIPEVYDTYFSCLVYLCCLLWTEHAMGKINKQTKLDFLTLTALHHLAVCCGCTATGSFWGRAPWVGAGHRDTSRPDPSECPYETGGRSERKPHPLWLTDICGERDKAKKFITP